jgi:hypothetical protein
VRKELPKLRLEYDLVFSVKILQKYVRANSHKLEFVDAIDRSRVLKRQTIDISDQAYFITILLSDFLFLFPLKVGAVTRQQLSAC